MNNKIGVAMVTHNRESTFKETVRTVPSGLVEFLVVNDGTPYSEDSYPDTITELIQHKANRGVGTAKNTAIRKMMIDGCDHIFVLEDDVNIIDPGVFEKYIATAEATGIRHLNYGATSTYNRMPPTPEGVPTPRLVVDYGPESIALYHHIAGTFTYYHRKVIEKVGLHDEVFKNAWEHVDHTLRVIQAGMHPPFWWFADVGTSNDYLQPHPDGFKASSIGGTTEFPTNMRYGAEYFKQLHGCYPVQIPATSQDQVIQALRDIHGAK